MFENSATPSGINLNRLLHWRELYVEGNLSYTFQKYGILDGVVRQVGADAQEKPEAGKSAAKSIQEAAYRALISLGTSHLESRGKKLRLVPGMLVNAEIHLGTRTVLEYLLSPVQKVAHEAGRER